jgi:hypothetical protein
MDAGSWIALYAAIVGTAALASQATTYIAARHPKIRVSASLVHILMSAENQKAARRSLESIAISLHDLFSSSTVQSIATDRVLLAAFTAISMSPLSVATW